jgi:hypothetical protein
VTATLCAATFSNIYVLCHKRCVMLRFVAVPMVALAHPHLLANTGKAPTCSKKITKTSESRGRQPLCVPLADGATFFRRRIIREKVRILYTDKK